MVIVKEMEKINQNLRKHKPCTVAKFYLSEKADGFCVKTSGSQTKNISQTIYFTGEALQQLRNILDEIDDLRTASLSDN